VPQLITSPSPEDFQHFGRAAALGGDILVVSDTMAEDSEFVYVYRKQGSSWVYDDTITIPIPFGDEFEFGTTLAVHNGDVIISSRDEDDPTIGVDAGALYIYEDGPAGWGIKQRLTASDGTPDDRFGDFDLFGDSLIAYALHGNTNGQNVGAAYVFEHDGKQWQETAKLAPTVPAPLTYEAGPTTRIGDTIFVGNPLGSNVPGIQTGVVHELRLQGGQWEFHTTHQPFNTADNSSFGRWVVSENNTLFVGDPGDAGNGLYSGTVYVYMFNGTSWVFQEQIRPADGAFGAWFGEHIAIDDNNLFISGNTLLSNDLPSIYHFELKDNAWVEKQKIITPSNLRFSFARGFSATDQTLIAPDENGPMQATQHGLVYIYDIECDSADCPADVNGDGAVTPTDFTAWINAFNNNLPECDQNGDGNCTPTDFTAWIANFNAGC
jgi:hypothetical protein